MIKRLALILAMVCISSIVHSSQLIFPIVSITQNGTLSAAYASRTQFLNNGALRVYDSSGKAIPLGTLSISRSNNDRNFVVTSSSKQIGSFYVYTVTLARYIMRDGKKAEDVSDTGIIIEYTPKEKGQQVSFSTNVNWGNEPILCRIEPEAGAGISQFSFGPALSNRCNSLFDKNADESLSVETESTFSHVNNSWKLETGNISTDSKPTVVLRLRISRDHMKSVQGYKWYKPLDRSVFDKAPSGWCSSYSYSGAITEKDMVESTDWIANNLKQFGFEYVQLDDGFQAGDHTWLNWNKKFPSGGKWMADYIHSKGMKAGIWLNPYTTNSQELLAAHPDWFLHDINGKVIGIFPSDYMVDCSNPEVIENWIKPIYKTLAVDWGYDYFKHDGQTDAVAAYARGVLNKPVTDRVEPYRAGLRAIREVIGKNRFILSCCCAPREGMGIIDGTRTGSDVTASWGRVRPAYDCTRDNVFMNNIGWICDPDVVCVRDPLTLNQSRLWVSFVGMTGQLFMAGDWLQRLPEERVELLRRVYPVAKIMPMDLYSLTDEQMNTMDLRVARPFGSWDVVGYFNWEERTKHTSLNIKSLSLPANSLGYAVYDFWNKQYLGIIKDAQNIDVPPTGCRLFSVAAVTNNPQVISTSRHITQGAMDLKEVKWDAKNMVLSGTSDVVGGDPYELRIVVPEQYKSYRAKATASKLDMKYSAGLLTLMIDIDQNREVSWEVQFGEKP